MSLLCSTVIFFISGLLDQSESKASTSNSHLDVAIKVFLRKSFASKEVAFYVVSLVTEVSEVTDKAISQKV